MMKQMPLPPENIWSSISDNNHIVWERGVKANKASYRDLRQWIYLLPRALLKPVLVAGDVGKSIDNMTFDLSSMSIYEILAEHVTETPIRLSGATLDQVLYYVSKGKPIIAMTGHSDAVLIYGYDTYNIFMVDPAKGKTVKLGIQDSTELFEKAGNIFISYLSQ